MEIRGDGKGKPDYFSLPDPVDYGSNEHNPRQGSINDSGDEVELISVQPDADKSYAFAGAIKEANHWCYSMELGLLNESGDWLIQGIWASRPAKVE